MLTLWNIWEFLIILFESFLFFLFMNRKLDSKKRIFKWQWCAWLLFSIILFFFKSDESINILYCVLRYHSAFFNYNDFYKFFSFFTVFLCYIVFDLCVACRCSVCNASSGSFSRKYQSGFIGRLGSGGFYIGLPDPAWCVDRIDDNDWKTKYLPADKGKADFYRNCVVVCGNRANRHDCCSKSITAIPGKRFFHACNNFCLCVIPVYEYAVIYL